MKGIFDGRFSGELCWEIVQQFTSEGPMNCFRGYPTDSPRRVVQYVYRISVVSFREQKALVLKNVILLAFGLGMGEGVGEDSRYGIGHVDIQVGSCICLSVFLLP